jgi:hypothetical protein
MAAHRSGLQPHMLLGWRSTDSRGASTEANLTLATYLRLGLLRLIENGGEVAQYWCFHCIVSIVHKNYQNQRAIALQEGMMEAILKVPHAHAACALLDVCAHALRHGSHFNMILSLSMGGRGEAGVDGKRKILTRRLCSGSLSWRSYEQRRRVLSPRRVDLSQCRQRSACCKV